MLIPSLLYWAFVHLYHNSKNLFPFAFIDVADGIFVYKKLERACVADYNNSMVFALRY